MIEMFVFFKRRVSIIVFLFWLITDCCWAVPLPESGEKKLDLQQSEQIEAILAELKQNDGIEVFYQKIPDFVWRGKTLYQTAGQTDAATLLKFLNLYKEEIEKYPSSFFAKLKIKGFVVVKKLFYKKRPVEGFFDDYTQLIFLDFLRSNDNPIAQRHNIHHEIFHAISVRAREAGLSALDESVWTTDQNNARNRSQQPMNFFDPPHRGFMTDYAMSSREEDKAEMYACFFVPSQNKIMQRWIQKDDSLRKKEIYIKSFVSGFCPEMGESYWRGLSQSLNLHHGHVRGSMARDGTL